jgi:hypothetical protein
MILRAGEPTGLQKTQGSRPQQAKASWVMMETSPPPVFGKENQSRKTPAFSKHGVWPALCCLEMGGAVIYIGMDDTDIKGSRGTGRLARQIAEALSARYRVLGITRHQLLFDPRVPYTSKNSSAAIHVDADGEVNLDALADDVQRLMLDDWYEGSDPGLCVARVVSPAMSEFGRQAKTTLVCQGDARALAAREACVLRGLGGTCDGVIGALAAVGLAASGEDGRFVQVGSSRELQGVQSVPSILACGISEVRTLDGARLDAGAIDTGGKLRPAFREGRAILFVTHTDGPHWQPVKLD